MQRRSQPQAAYAGLPREAADTLRGLGFTLVGGNAHLDLDKAQLYHGAVPSSRRVANFARLKRSAHKLDPERRYLDAKLLAILTAS